MFPNYQHQIIEQQNNYKRDTTDLSNYPQTCFAVSNEHTFHAQREGTEEEREGTQQWEMKLGHNHLPATTAKTGKQR